VGFDVGKGGGGEEAADKCGDVHGCVLGGNRIKKLSEFAHRHQL
jgi:hypothetical protein